MEYRSYNYSDPTVVLRSLCVEQREWQVPSIYYIYHTYLWEKSIIPGPILSFVRSMKFLNVQETLFQSHHSFTHACRKTLGELNWLQKIPIKMWLRYEMILFFFPKPEEMGVIIRKSNNMCTCSIMGVFVVFLIKPTKCYRWLNPWSMVYNTKIGYDNFKI